MKCGLRLVSVICIWEVEKKRWQRHTLPHRLQCSTICAHRLNFRVRDGTGWTPVALITNTLLTQIQLRPQSASLTPIASVTLLMCSFSIVNLLTLFTTT